MNEDAGKRGKNGKIRIDFLPDEEERKGQPGCPGGNASWPSGCYEHPQQPGGCWGKAEKS